MVKYVGIVNVTPDSFSDGGKFLMAEKALGHAYELFENGATIIDFGAQSTRPNATRLSVQQEWQRLEPVVSRLIDVPFEVSIDTFYPEVIEKVRDFVPNVIINDVTMAHSPGMQKLLATSGLRIFLSHLPLAVGGDIQAAHTMPHPVDDANIVKQELLERRDELIALGTRPEQIILDPGIGFGKTMRLNAELIEFASLVPKIPVMIGFSRKRFIEQFLHQDRFDPAVNAALAHEAIDSGAAYLRVHTVTSEPTE